MIEHFSSSLLNLALGYATACIGSFLGLRCVALARAYRGLARASWLGLAAVSIGATGIWATHFIAMLGFTIPEQTILYNVPLTIGSMLVAVVVVGLGLFVAGLGGGLVRLVAGGVVVGLGEAAVHYMGMAAMSMPDSMSYSMPLLVLSVLTAIAAGMAVLWSGTRVRGLAATIGAALIIGVVISGMHYAGMAAVRITSGSMSSMGGTASAGMTSGSGATAVSFLIPVLLVIGLVTFLTTLTISMSPTEEEILANAEMQRRMDYLQHRHGLNASLLSGRL